MGILDLGRYKGIVFAITGFLVFIAIILAVNHGKAGQFSDNVAGVRFLENQAQQPHAVYDASVQLAQRLENGEKIDEALERLRKAATTFDRSLNSLANGGMITDSAGEIIVLPSMTEPAAVTQLKNGSKLWDGYKAKLDPILRFSGSPYVTTQPAPAPAPAPAANGKNAAPVVARSPGGADHSAQPARPSPADGAGRSHCNTATPRMASFPSC